MRGDFDNFCGWFRLGLRRRRDVFRSVSCEGIRKRTDGLRGRRNWRALHARRRIADVFLRLLAQRGYLEPRARSHHQDFKRRTAKNVIRAAVSVERSEEHTSELQ